MRQHAIIGFPVTILLAGEERTIQSVMSRPFRAEKLVINGFMDELRGHFKIKRSRLPLLNRDHATAYSKISKHAKRRRTIVEYHCDGRNFVRSYLPASVVYLHVDPLSYIALGQLRCDEVPSLPSIPGGIPAECFRHDALGNGLSMPIAQAEISLTLRNHGDIDVRVVASIFGTSPSV